MNTPENLATVSVNNEEETAALANDLAEIVSQGEVLALTGELGAGKSTFCRSVIRSLTEDESLEVPSPTFTLVQPYQAKRFNLAHFDLYRLGDSAELIELGFDDFFDDSVLLIEWAEKGGNLIPNEALWIKIEIGQGESERQFSFHGNAEKWQKRLNCTMQIRKFLNMNGYHGVKRSYLQGDASFRQYETIEGENKRFVLMNDASQTGKSGVCGNNFKIGGTEISNSIRSFVAIDKLLEQSGIRVPKIHAMDLESGLLLLEHLGSEPILENGLPIEERYLVAVELLAQIHELNWPPEIETEFEDTYQIPHFDLSAMLTDVEVFLDWYVVYGIEKTVSNSQRQDFLKCWSGLFEFISESEQSLVLRDFHSPNLLWQADESGNNRIGVLDFQDALIGPSAYDLASLVQDARATVPLELQENMVEYYMQCRRKLGTKLNQANTARDVSILAAYRATRILGVFVRLSKRDNKPYYLRHMPRVLDYLQQNLNHTVMAELRDFVASEGWV